MCIYKPYTYWLFHKPSKTFYYGSRTAKGCAPSDLWSTYFTSSKVVAELLRRDGPECFISRIDKVFDTASECINYEYKILQHFSAGTNIRFLNKHHTKSIVWTPKLRNKASKSHSGKPLSDCHRLKISEGKKGKKRKPFTEEHLAKLSASRKGKVRSLNTKALMRISARSRAIKYTYTKNNEIYVGCQADWAEKFNLNRNYAATAFSQHRSYKGWSRSFA